MKANATLRANELLSQRLVELLRELEISETAVETFRRAGGMLGDKTGTIITQQLPDECGARRRAQSADRGKIPFASGSVGVRKGGDLQALSDVLLARVLLV